MHPSDSGPLQVEASALLSESQDWKSLFTVVAAKLAWCLAKKTMPLLVFALLSAKMLVEKGFAYES